MNAILLASATAVVPQNELLVNMVRLRVRQLVQGARPLVLTPPGMGLCDVALSEIGAKKLSFELDAIANPETAPAAVIDFPAAAGAKKKAA